MRTSLLCICVIFFLFACSGLSKKDVTDRVKSYSEKREAVLNRLHNEINRVYGFADGNPRVNRGPCGRFARDFREQWNRLFEQKINIVFAMTADRQECYHVLVKLPDGRYYDGGNGVIPGTVLYRQYTGGLKLDEMKSFDYDLLDKRSYSLARTYRMCPNYSDDTTRSIIARHLKELVQ
jgi:hypothetical protein